MRKLQQGFSLVSAIFLLVVLSFLGIAMVSFFAAQQQSSTMDVMGSRAYQAARAGIDWAAYQVVNSPASSPTSVGCATSFAQGSLGGALSPFAVTVTCQAASSVEGASSIWIYDVSAEATTGTPGGPDFVDRVLSVRIGK